MKAIIEIKKSKKVLVGTLKMARKIDAGKNVSEADQVKFIRISESFKSAVYSCAGIISLP